MVIGQSTEQLEDDEGPNIDGLNLTKPSFHKYFLKTNQAYRAYWRATVANRRMNLTADFSSMLPPIITANISGKTYSVPEPTERPKEKNDHPIYLKGNYHIISEKHGQYVRTNFTAAETFLMLILQHNFPLLMEQYNKTNPYKLQKFTSLAKSSYSFKFQKENNTWIIVDNEQNSSNQHTTKFNQATTTMKPHKIELGLLNGTPTLIALPADDPCKLTSREFFQK